MIEEEIILRLTCIWSGGSQVTEAQAERFLRLYREMQEIDAYEREEARVAHARKMSQPKGY